MFIKEELQCDAAAESEFVVDPLFIKGIADKKSISVKSEVHDNEANYPKCEISTKEEPFSNEFVSQLKHYFKKSILILFSL